MSNHYDKTCNPVLATSAGATTVLATSADAKTPVSLATSADGTPPSKPHFTPSLTREERKKFAETVRKNREMRMQMPVPRLTPEEEQWQQMQEEKERKESFKLRMTVVRAAREAWAENEKRR
jgi:hypothetical protein